MREKSRWAIYYGDRFDIYPKNFNEIDSHDELQTYSDILDFYRKCKIGITSNIDSRMKTLKYKENTIIHKVIYFEGTYAQALKIESDLRFLIEQSYPHMVTHCGNDHFRCITLGILKSINKNFDRWVENILIDTKIEKIF